MTLLEQMMILTAAKAGPQIDVSVDLFILT